MDDITNEEWEKAKNHLINVIDQYKELIGMPGVNVTFALLHLDKTLQEYNAGRRTNDLYVSMMNAE